MSVLLDSVQGNHETRPSLCLELKGTAPRSLLEVSRKDLKSAACRFVLEMTGGKDGTCFDFSLTRFCGVSWGSLRLCKGFCL